MNLSEPEMSIEYLMELIKGFVDMLILASGYQSTGRFAYWDSCNIKKAFQWALLLENMIRNLKESDNKDFMKSLDEAIRDMTSDPSFPQALACLSSDKLTTARKILSEHMLRAFPVRTEHLRALMTATTELDLDELKPLGPDYFNIHLDNLMLLGSSSRKDGGVECNTSTSSSLSDRNMSIESSTVGDHSKYVIQELARRQDSTSCMQLAKTNMSIISESVSSNDLSKQKRTKYQEEQDPATCALDKEQYVDFVVWSQWRSRILSYFIDNRTVRLVSGANLIFSTPKLQWIQVFKQLNLSSEVIEDDLLETLEILLLGCISSQWDQTIQYFMSVPFDSLDISKQYHELCNLLLRPQLDVEVAFSKVKDILEFVIELFNRKQYFLWKLSPALVAAAIPPWSPLFRFYLSEIESQLKGECSPRHCNCMKDGKEHTSCTSAERIWCLHVFHVRRPQHRCNASGR